MGLDSASVKFLCAAKSRGVDFSTTGMLGRQGFRPDSNTLQRVFSVLGIDRDAQRFLSEDDYCEPFFALLGAKQVVSVDASDYEGATVVHDMNRPIPDSLRERFSVLHDGGSLEHIFNAPQALKNCMEMVKVGGHFTQVSNANNFMGHGFWQFSPELIYRVFSPANGFLVEVLLLHERVPDGGWYIVADPEQVRTRVELCNSAPTYILTIARRMTIKEIFADPPQQSDYIPLWNGDAVAASPQSVPRPAGLKRLVPVPVKRTLRRFLKRPAPPPRWPGFDRPYYRRIDEDDLLHGRQDEHQTTCGSDVLSLTNA